MLIEEVSTDISSPSHVNPSHGGDIKGDIEGDIGSDMEVTSGVIWVVIWGPIGPLDHWG